MFIIVLNTVILAMDKYPAWDKETQSLFKSINLFFTVVFTGEVVFKLCGLGLRGYVADRFNIFDGIIVIISIVELVIVPDGESGGAFGALRTFRLFRIVKMFRAGDLRTLLDSIGYTVLTIKDYTILLSLFIFVFALLGMNFFAGNVKFNDDDEVDMVNGSVPRINFDHFGTACLTVFEIMIGENWNSMMYNHLRSVGMASCAYFISLVVLGNVIMLNLFLAILLGNFDKARNQGEKKKVFNAFDGMAKMGYKLNISIAYLFDDVDFTKYIEDKVLNKKDGDDQKDMKKALIGDDECDQKESQIHT